ncbi:MAG: flagellar biosynthesis protein FlhA [Waddliaceae bacterium]|nr:flagellar biosynthesis protein FlhA [Waddliaceae bacterium]
MLEGVLGKIGAFGRYSDIMLAIAVVGLVLLMVIPLPPVLMDVLLSMSIVLAVTTLLLTLYTEEALEFSSFPSLLLFLTIFRLSLNIASTRMILANAQAGDIIKTFGDFVTGGSQAVGLIIFILLTVINFVVITKGSGRVAEVAARFTLDAMPGKQMSIDADLNAGVIDEEEAKTRREKITSEADFYGSMDGASKFVRGDAIAGIVITVVNIFGGFVIGMFMHGMSWAEAMETYMTLTVGDGLVTQIPALLISVGAGIIVTRASSSENLGSTFQRQIFSNPKVLFITGAIIFVLAFVPGMPMIVMFPISGALCAYAYALWKAAAEKLEESDVSLVGAVENGEVPTSAGEDVEKVLFVDPMEVELGYGLIPLVDQAQGGDLLQRITIIRRQIASELGIVVPPIRIRDNMLLDSDIYIIKIKGIEVARGVLYLDSFLAMNPGSVTQEIPGIETVEPAFGIPALWISQSQKETAELHGYTVVDTLSVLATHLTEVIHIHADEILNRQEATRLIENAKAYASAVIEELVPNQMTVGQVMNVFQNLLHERVPIRDIVTILESLADHSSRTKDIDVLTEYARQGLSRSISRQFSDEENVLYVLTLDPRVEEMFHESLHTSEFGTRLVLNPTTVNKLMTQLAERLDEANANGAQPIILCSSTLRKHLKQLIERGMPRLAVLSFNEISADTQIESAGVISNDILA